jgi:thiaminase/transcriptional activator TenA
MDKSISWSEEVWNESNSVVEKIKNHKFIQELMEGVLNENIFKEYIIQDIMYCDIFNSCMKKLSEKIDIEEYNNKLLEFSKSKSSISMREFYKNKYGLIPDTKKNNVNGKYTSLIIDSVENKSIQEGLSSMLACYWVYFDVGNYIHDNQIKNKDNKYQNWIDNYGNPNYGKKVECYKNICDYYANLDPSKKESMKNIFLQCAQYEYDFFNEVYETICK